MIILPYQKQSLFRRYVAICGDYVAYGPTRNSALSRVLGMLATLHESI